MSDVESNKGTESLEAALTWDFAGWGSAERMTDLSEDQAEVSVQGAKPEHKLGQWSTTAICGNDITSSCLYVSALAGVAAGILAPLVLLTVAAVLFLYRKIYGEVGSALPLNGGTYTLLLNSSNKKFAAIAACLTLLSYIATAVISAGEAMHYAHTLWSGLDVLWATILLLGMFALLNIIGITESAKAALIIFIFHIVTLTLLSIACGIQVAGSTDTFVANWHIPPPGGIMHALFFGFAAAMLGISGFESSANFIEEQKPGVFPKTLRNMWIAVAIFNPLISFLSMGMIPLSEFEANQNSLLSLMGERSGGSWLAMMVSIDAVFVLSGAVLTSYVGVTGLVRRMSLDRCLPQALLAENKWRRTNHWIIFGFFLLCVSILATTLSSDYPDGNVGLLAGVYTLSFLAVMSLFAVGNMMLKVVRSRLPRAVKASWPSVVIALTAVLIGLVGNLTLPNIEVFGTYFAVVGSGVATMFLRIPLYRVLLFVSKSIMDRVMEINAWVDRLVNRKVKEINDLTVVYFTKGDSESILNRAALYVLENEQTQRMKIVHVYADEGTIPTDLSSILHSIDKMYPNLRIDFLAVKGVFGPDLIEKLSRRLKVPKNYMFIGTPGDKFPHEIAALGGVRLIL